MKKDAVDISTVFYDDRDGNKARPYCIIVKTPNPNGPTAWPKFGQVWRVRMPTPEQAEAMRVHLRTKRKNTRALATFIEYVEHVQYTGKIEAQQRSQKAYEERQSAVLEASETLADR